MLLARVIVIAATTVAAAASPDDHFDWVTIGEPGNIGYPGGPVGISAGRGSVDYEYRIGRTQVTAGQWLAFYNTFSVQSGQLAQTLRPAFWPAYQDFSYQGPGDRYEFFPTLHHPELSPIGINWRQAAMFCNWLHNGHSSDPASLLNGAYDTATFTYNEDTNTFNDQATRHPDARYWIPSLDEWLKAAHYDPNKNGQGPGWWEYAHSSDAPPVYGMPGEGDVARQLTQEQMIQLAGPGASPLYIPLGLYPDVQSPWGLLDLLGGNREFVEDWDPDAPNFWRLGKFSTNGPLPNDYMWDQAWYFDTWHVGRAGSFRIASAIPCPADLAPPFGVLDATDLAAYLDLFQSGDAAADLAEPFGVINFFDLAAYLTAFNAGCP
ncbi:MAG: formylglycine-generating enzyme family protein [Phycisphaerales bacterium]|nr:SUMF1/EgtB/PvdO family nonheme iron enzyme [Planctomycetota bacterium]MCH8508924.1 formylglycine-generating enzyme family protein [Phycisphaerales bacterium]